MVGMQVGIERLHQFQVELAQQLTVAVDLFQHRIEDQRLATGAACAPDWHPFARHAPFWRVRWLRGENSARCTPWRWRYRRREGRHNDRATAPAVARNGRPRRP